METNSGHLTLASYEAAARGPLTMWPLIGVLAGLLFASFAIDSAAARGVAVAVYVVGVFIAVFWQITRTGVQPRFDTMPQPLRRNLYGFWVASALVGVVAMVLSFATNFVIGGVVVALCVTVGGITYHRRSRILIDQLTGE